MEYGRPQPAADGEHFVVFGGDQESFLEGFNFLGVFICQIVGLRMILGEIVKLPSVIIR